MTVKKIIAYTLITLGTLATYFFLNYKGTLIPYPLLLAALSAVLVLLGSRLLIRAAIAKNEDVHTQITKQIDDLKVNGEKITVALSQCEILENHYTEELERHTSMAMGSAVPFWNALTNREKDIEHVAVHQSVLVYKHEDNGRTEEFFSPVLPYDRTTLLLKLTGRETTNIYRSRAGDGMYYFDLAFLYE